MGRDLALRLVAAIVAALVVLAVLFHVVLFLIVQMCFDTQWALVMLMALLVWDAFTLIGILRTIGSVYMGEGIGDGGANE